MQYNKKMEIIQSLAEHMGVVDNFNTKYEKPKYDKVTGTFWCEGIKLPHSSIKEIKDWYKEQMYIYKDQINIDPVKREYYLRYAVAYNAICLLEDNVNKDDIGGINPL